LVWRGFSESNRIEKCAQNGRRRPSYFLFLSLSGAVPRAFLNILFRHPPTTLVVSFFFPSHLLINFHILLFSPFPLFYAVALSTSLCLHPSVKTGAVQKAEPSPEKKEKKKQKEK